MQGVSLHHDKRPPLGKGSILLPIVSWQAAKSQFRIFRAEDTREHGRKSFFVTLIQIPDQHPVALIHQSESFTLAELTFTPLSHLSQEDRELLNDFLQDRTDAPPDISSSSISFLCRLVMGAPLPRSSIKWTKDLQLLEHGDKKTKLKGQ